MISIPCNTVVRLKEYISIMLAFRNEQVEVFQPTCYHQTYSVKNPRALDNKAN